MAEGDGRWQNKTKADCFRKTIDFVNDTIRVALCYGTQPVIDGTVVLADITQIAATGYTAVADGAGYALATKAVTQDDTNDRGKFDADDAAFGAVGTPNHAITYAAFIDDTLANNPVLGTIELLASDHQPNGGTYTLQFHADGIGLLT